jgi:hypothetical protein
MYSSRRRSISGNVRPTPRGMSSSEALSAIRALAQMRKLLKGGAITQINIADKQINTTG